jgi:hypothetical protein
MSAIILLALWAAIVVLVMLPPRYDPAILLKQWLEKRKGKD